jgi:hypothetical protein
VWANLKHRYSDIYARLVADFQRCNAMMLPLDVKAFTSGFTGGQVADHFGIRNAKTLRSGE